MTTVTSPADDARLYGRIASDLSLQVSQVQQTVALLLDDATVPFIARYRKEATGNLDEEQIRRIAARHTYYQQLEQRRTTVLNTIAKQGKLSAELRQQIVACVDKTELEDLYLPYRPRRQTKAQVAIERGLEPLARLAWEQRPNVRELEAYAETLVHAERGVASVAEALAGAGHIVAEWIAEHAEVRKALRTMMHQEGSVRAIAVAGKEGETSKFQDYYDFREPVTSIPSHRFLAIMRGARQGLLSVTIEVDRDKALTLVQQYVASFSDASQAPHLAAWAADAYQRLLAPTLQTETQRWLKERADTEAIAVFQENLRSLLMAPPLGTWRVLGIDPGLRTGCKLAVVDETGTYMEQTTIFPLPPREDREGAEQCLRDLIHRHGVQAIAIGNGTGARETEGFVRQFIQRDGLSDLYCVMVSEAGASVYAASRLARQELPTLDVTVRGAVSIARRLQDPLAELVKIDPKSIGVGQYQHDVQQKRLRQSLEETVGSCVNRVGVDVNTASVELLQYVSGLNRRQAMQIVAYRQAHGRFTNREQLRQVSGLGGKTFQQAAGFWRIREGDNALDNTRVHPEAYGIVERIAACLGVPVSSLVGNADLLARLDLQHFVDEQFGLPTLQDVREELLAPGRDPRQQFVMPRFRDDVTTLTQLQKGMVLDGVVSNVTNFGAFVDVGVHQDGLVHISELSSRFIRDPREVVQVGQVVKVKVLDVDRERQRISLSMKGTRPATARPATPSPPDSPPRRRRKRVAVPKTAAAPKPAVVMADKLRELQAHFQGADTP